MNGVRTGSDSDTLERARYEVVAAEGGVTAPAGFRSAGVHCGIKKSPSALDLAIIEADAEASAAGIFTTNLAQAAPVIVSRRHLERSKGIERAIVVNSGCANACTGTQGMADADRMAAEVATTLGCSP